MERKAGTASENVCRLTGGNIDRKDTGQRVTWQPPKRVRHRNTQFTIVGRRKIWEGVQGGGAPETLPNPTKRNEKPKTSFGEWAEKKSLDPQQEASEKFRGGPGGVKKKPPSGGEMMAKRSLL